MCGFFFGVSDTDNSGELDLDLVNSTTSLSNMGARHKISVRPQRTRPSAQHRRPVKAPVAGAAMVLTFILQGFKTL